MAEQTPPKFQDDDVNMEEDVENGSEEELEDIEAPPTMEGQEQDHEIPCLVGFIPTTKPRTGGVGGGDNRDNLGLNNNSVAKENLTKKDGVRACKNPKTGASQNQKSGNHWGGAGSSAGNNNAGGGSNPSGSGGSGGDDDPYRNISLQDVGGLDTQKAYLTNIILRPLQNPEEKAMFPPPKGILFYGPPGTGKTLLARAFGNDLSKALNKPVTFYHRKGGDFLSMYFGESGRIIRDLFKQAKELAPSIIFLDELDGVCPNRDGPYVGEAYTSVVTTLLGEMDTITPGEVFVFGATNRLEAVDPAMRRPGRFDKHLEFFPPNLEARKRILQLGTKKWMAHSQPNEAALHELGQATAGYTGADLDVLCRNVFYTAFQRHVPDGDLNIGVDDLKILPEDWAKALSQMKPSNNAVFDSSLYTPQPPEKEILQLIATSVKDLGKTVEKNLAIISKGCERWDNAGSPSQLIVNTLFITDIRRPNDDSLENFVIPAIFTQEKIEKVPIYQLNREELICAMDKEMKIAKITEQSGNSLVPCILYVPKIDDLIKDCPTVVPWMLQQFSGLRGKPVLLIATASVLVGQITDSGIRRMFCATSKCALVQKPTDQERYNFLGDAISTLLTTILPGERPTKEVLTHLNTLKEKAAIGTRGKSIESIQYLHDGILLIAAAHVRFDDKSGAIRELEQLITETAAARSGANNK